ncbi:MAG: hypothetical protein BGO55_23055 [Sphingobacteriales bacterium 50-39]|nr:secretin and TonB N-terminal domain-containing protein [Sphingobacteriales bacterium]OJW58189.1 MAG: hypothetical protein BGO55_23055 [Sphingobacteriales bacterium 50-39]
MRFKILLLCCLLLTGGGITIARGQSLPDTTVSISLKEATLQDAFSAIGERTGIRFDYNPEVVKGKRKLSLEVRDMPLRAVLEQLLRGTGLAYTLIGKGVVIREDGYLGKVTFSGFVKDLRTDERLINASIYLPEGKTGVMSNRYGFYSLEVSSSDTATLLFTYVGYADQVRRLPARRDSQIIITLEQNEERQHIPATIVAPDESLDNVEKNRSSLVSLSSDMLRAAPSSAGGGDVMHAVQMLPGVQAGLEGTPGYSVRGGNTGQNIVLLDEASIYNPSHLFGLVSIFNPMAVKYADFVKGGFPAINGDHISSVLDVSIKDGSSQAVGGSVEAGSIASGIALYGPLAAEKSSWFIAGRRSMIDVWLHPFASDNYFSNYYFYDVNAKMNWRLSGRDRLIVSLYRGMDKNDYSHDASQDAGIGYHTDFGNLALALRWNHLYSRHLFSNTSIIYNHYQQVLSASQQGYFAELYSGIRDMNIRSDLSWYLSAAHKLDMGGDVLYQSLFPAAVSDRASSFNSNFPINPAGVPHKDAWRSAVYLSDDMRWGSHLKVYAGVRLPFYWTPLVEYVDIEPRLSLLYRAGDHSSVKISYSRMHQYIHLVQSYNASFPAEIWLGSSPLAQPESGDEYTAGFFRNFHDNNIQGSIEIYYKAMDHQSLFKGVTSPVIDNSLEDKLIFGKAWSYGSELLLRKTKGRWKGWLAYSYAYSWQQFDSLNQGKKFPFSLDRRHSVSASLSYELDRHWKAFADMVLSGGRAFTLHATRGNNNSGSNDNPLYESEKEDDGTTVPSVQDEANNYRLTPYNRLDLGLSYHKERTVHRRTITSTWTLVVYNVYGRDNTLFAYRTIDPVTQKASVTQTGFLPVIPNLSYKLTF